MGIKDSQHSLVPSPICTEVPNELTESTLTDKALPTIPDDIVLPKELCELLAQVIVRLATQKQNKRVYAKEAAFVETSHRRS